MEASSSLMNLSMSVTGISLLSRRQQWPKTPSPWLLALSGVSGRGGLACGVLTDRESVPSCTAASREPSGACRPVVPRALLRLPGVVSWELRSGDSRARAEVASWGAAAFQVLWGELAPPGDVLRSRVSLAAELPWDSGLEPLGDAGWPTCPAASREALLGEEMRAWGRSGPVMGRCPCSGAALGRFPGEWPVSRWDGALAAGPQSVGTGPSLRVSCPRGSFSMGPPGWRPVAVALTVVAWAGKSGPPGSSALPVGASVSVPWGLASASGLLQ